MKFKILAALGVGAAAAVLASPEDERRDDRPIVNEAAAPERPAPQTENEPAAAFPFRPDEAAEFMTTYGARFGVGPFRSDCVRGANGCAFFGPGIISGYASAPGNDQRADTINVKVEGEPAGQGGIRAAIVTVDPRTEDGSHVLDLFPSGEGEAVLDRGQFADIEVSITALDGGTMFIASYEK